MKYDLIAIDVDGTLLNSSHQITTETKECLRALKKEGKKIVIATGRPLIGILKIIKELDFFDDQDYVISFNGSVISTVNGKTSLLNDFLTIEECIKITQELNKYSRSYQFVSKDNIFTMCNPINPYSISDSILTGMPLYYSKEIINILRGCQIVKIMLLDEKEELSKLITKLPAWVFRDYTAIRTLDNYFEFLKQNVSKGNALSRLAKYLKISPNNIVAIGDNQNDLSMITYAGVGVAMGNAEDEIKQVADLVALTNDENGVAEVLKQLIK